jgi:hypothetical protein
MECGGRCASRYFLPAARARCCVLDEDSILGIRYEGYINSAIPVRRNLDPLKPIYTVPVERSRSLPGPRAHHQTVYALHVGGGGGREQGRREQGPDCSMSGSVQPLFSPA